MNPRDFMTTEQNINEFVYQLNYRLKQAGFGFLTIEGKIADTDLCLLLNDKDSDIRIIRYRSYESVITTLYQPLSQASITFSTIVSDILNAREDIFRKRQGVNFRGKPR